MLYFYYFYFNNICFLLLEIFAMTKTHKEIAVFMTSQAENNQLNEKMFIKVKFA